MNNSPLVTVIVPTHNRLELLKRALNSLEAQDYEPIEVIVVDDASSDGTQDYLFQVGHRLGWKIVRNNVAQGACASRNTGIRYAAGEYVANLDDDDFFEPSRISSLVLAFGQNISAVTSYDKLWDEKGRRRIWRKKSEITFDDLLYRNRAGNAFLTRTVFLRKIGGFDPALISAQDHDVFVRLAKAFGPIATVPRVLHNVDANESMMRISTSSRKWVGYYMFYCKHKLEMNRYQRKSNLFTIKRAQGKVKFATILNYAPPRFWPVELKAWAVS